jgi:two-component system response regulator AtoC
MMPNEPHILVVDDDPAVGKVLSAILGQAAMQSTQATGADEALAALARYPFDLVISDVRMPGLDGLSLMRRVVSEWPEVPVILLTGHGTIPLAVEAMRSGAADFMTKPFDREEVLFAVRKALAIRRELGGAGDSEPDTDTVSESALMRDVMDLVRRAAPSNSNVLLRGETGTGKSFLAREIHRLSPRHEGPFVTVVCAALPEPLIESELFGHEKGAFTGAATRKPGRVEMARGGTLLFDEIGEISPSLQVKLLRLLQDRDYERVGGTETLHADVRFIAATNTDLEAAVSDGVFRADLYYRLNVVPISLPPLRERPGELRRLIARFFEEQAKRAGKPSMQLAEDAVSSLTAHSWPGNLRELQNFLERLVVLADGPVVQRRDVEREKVRLPAFAEPSPAAGGGSLLDRRAETERVAVVEALQKSANNRTLAARLLGVSRRSLYNKLREHGLE